MVESCKESIRLMLMVKSDVNITAVSIMAITATMFLVRLLLSDL